jgi:hypothetical protein
MADSTLTSFAAVQAFLTQVITQNGNEISSAKHKAFWNTLNYTQFTTGNVPNVSPPVRILIPKNSAQSNIIMASSAKVRCSAPPEPTARCPPTAHPSSPRRRSTRSPAGSTPVAQSSRPAPVEPEPVRSISRIVLWWTPRH